MTDYTARELGTQSFTARTLGTTSWTERGSIDVNPTMGDDETVTDQTAPVISNVHAVEIKTDEITFGWDTDEDANCRVDLGTGTNVLEWTLGRVHEHYITAHRNYVVTGLEESTTYYFIIRSADRLGNSRNSNRYTVKTAKVGGGDAGDTPTIST